MVGHEILIQETIQPTYCDVIKYVKFCEMKNLGGLQDI